MPIPETCFLILISNCLFVTTPEWHKALAVINNSCQACGEVCAYYSQYYLCQNSCVRLTQKVIVNIKIQNAP